MLAVEVAWYKSVHYAGEEKTQEYVGRHLIYEFKNFFHILFFSLLLLKTKVALFFCKFVATA